MRIIQKELCYCLVWEAMIFRCVNNLIGGISKDLMQMKIYLVSVFVLLAIATGGVLLFVFYSLNALFWIDAPLVSRSDALGIRVRPLAAPSAFPVQSISPAFASADRYEARNDALQSVARRRDLASDDVALLMSYVESTNCILRVEREAALRNDVLNLLRNQKPVPDGLSAILVGMVERGGYDPAILDYCVQHLGALWPDLRDDVRRNRVRDLLVLTAHDISNPCAGTALYSLAEGIGPGKDDGLLRRLTLAACAKDANPLVRLSALQLAGERGYREALPSARAVLCGSRRDAVLDTVAAWTVGLLGDASDFKVLENLRQKGGRRVRVAVDTAVARINGREGKENVK